MKNQTLIFTALISAIFLLSFTSEHKTDTKVFVSKNAGSIKNNIELYSKYGYTVKSITAQSVAVGDMFYSTNGDLILIMEK